MILRAFSLVLLALIVICTPVQAQYRWVDKNGKVQFSDTPPPAGAKDVRKERAYAPSTGDSDAVPFAVARAQKDFPVTLYSSPVCKNPCDMARALLNKRGVPFAEISVWDEASQEKLKRVAGVTDEVPVLTVGRSVQKGFQAESYESLLDTAGYPGAGSVAPRTQAAPALPDGYTSPDPKPMAKPLEGAPAQKAGPYDPSGLTGPPPKQGRYGVPGELK